ncbi:MAG: T9SS type A sorting domain-containing protein [Chitinophagaceae bacterium]|nr:T9SS type A sorting domain-containing protein [Chitinophagaceae bacterium]
MGECSGERLTVAEVNATMNCYPNPFSESTSISISLPQSEKVSLKIYDVTGRLVKTLADGMLAERENKIEWKVMDENAGIYFLRMETETAGETVRLIVVR